jgi:hypothetical protein
VRGFLDAASTEADRCSTDSLKDQLIFFLSTVDDRRGDILQEWADCRVYDEVLKLYRGLLALITPEPRPFGATPADVDFIIPLDDIVHRMKNGTASHLCQTQLSVAKTLWRYLNKTEGERAWKDRKDAYQRFLGGEGKYGEQVNRLNSDLIDIDDKEASLVKSEGQEALYPNHATLTASRQELLKQFGECAETWRSSLRPQALWLIEETMACILTRQFTWAKSVLASNPASIHAAQAVDNCCQSGASFDPDFAPGQVLLQEVMEESSLLKESGVRVGLIGALKKLTDQDVNGEVDVALVNAVFDAYEHARNNNSMDVLSALMDSRQHVWLGYTQALLRGETPTKAIKLLQNMLEDPALRKLSGGDAAKNDIEMLTMMDIIFEDVSQAAVEARATVDDSGTKQEIALDKLMKAMAELDKLAKAACAFNDNDAYQSAYQTLQAHALTVTRRLMSLVCTMSIRILKRKLKAVAALTEKLKPLSGGTESGKSWYAAAPPTLSTSDTLANEEPLYDFVSSVLKDQKFNKLEACLKETLEAVSAYEISKMLYSEHLPANTYNVESESTVGDDRKIIEAAKKSALRTRCTKLEILLSRLLAKLREGNESLKASEPANVKAMCASCVKDLTAWKIAVPLFKESLWPPLYKRFSQLLPE